jgi:3-phenylpropionate/trans-cinnamate dioxygenase ferredoxin subunit
MTGRCRVAGLADVAPGSLLRVDPEGVPICLARLASGEVYALSDICSHEAVDLSDGDLDGDEVECPAHGARFNVETGDVSGLPADEPVKAYKVFVEDDDVFIEL